MEEKPTKTCVFISFQEKVNSIIYLSSVEKSFGAALHKVGPGRDADAIF